MPVNPELVVPGVLGVFVLVDAVTDGLNIWSIIIGTLGAVTVLLATMSLYALYSTDPGMFAGGLFTLAAGVPLVLLVLGRRTIATVSRRGRRTTASSTQ